MNKGAQLIIDSVERLRGVGSEAADEMALQEIFPDGAPNRAYLTRMLAASTVFVPRRFCEMQATRPPELPVGCVV